MKDSKSEIADWLRDAHAMESNLVNMLEGQVEHLSGFPEIQRSVSRHAEESKRHASLVEDALKLLGEDTSALKEAVAKFTGLMSPLGVGMTSDAPVKIVLANYAAEHFEIACYRSLQTAAEQAGLTQIAEICLEILEDEENMVVLLEPAISEVTATHLRNL